MSQPQASGVASAAAQPKKPKPERKKRDRGSSSYAFTIQEFCDAHRISRAQYYKLRALEQGPDEARAGDRTVIITVEAATRWRRQREKAARA
jgi:hypothetical protein